MTTGAVNARLEAVLELTVQSRESQQEIEAVIDTGFNGFLTLPPTIINMLSLRWLARQQPAGRWKPTRVRRA
jgi:predicted aspartyl protease